MLILYSKSGCPFCIDVERFLQDRGIEYEERDVYTNEEWMDELLELGGKRQMPYLVDTERGVSMYESQDIIKYVADTYGEHPSVDV